MMSERRGVALMLVLMLTGVCAIFLSAFVAINRDNFAQLNHGRDAELAYQACLSGQEYVWAQLSRDRTWGAAALPDLTVRVPSGEPLVEISTGDTNLVRGRFLRAQEARFEVRVYNNLENASLLTRAGLDVPPRSVRLQVTGSSGRAVRHLDCVLERAPLVDSSAISQGDMTVSVDQLDPRSAGWWVMSRDAARNLVRSNSNVVGPLPRTGSPRLYFANTADPNSAAQGSIRARGEIALRDSSGNRYNMSSNDAARQEAESSSRGRFLTDQPNYQIPDIQPAMLKKPTQVTEIPGGTYSFRTDTNGDLIFERFPPGSTTATNTIRRAPPADPTAPVLVAFSNVTLDLRSRAIGLPANKRVDVQGGITLKASSAGGPPGLWLGGAGQEAALVANGPGASIDIQGFVVGGGSMIAADDAGDVKIQLGSAVAASATQPIALYAGRNVTLSQGSNNPWELGTTDWDMFAGSNVKSINGIYDWAQQPRDQKPALVTRALQKTMPQEQFQTAWGSLLTDYPNAEGYTFPDGRSAVQYALDEFNGSGANTTAVTVDSYVRLRAFLASAEAGAPDGNWLVASSYAAEVQGVTQSLLEQLQGAAGAHQEPGPPPRMVANRLGDYLGQASNPLRAGDAPPMVFFGLIYARHGDFDFDAGRRGILVEGSVVVKEGRLNISRSRLAWFVYNPTYLENLFVPQVEAALPLQPTYFAVY